MASDHFLHGPEFRIPVEVDIRFSIHLPADPHGIVCHDFYGQRCEEDGLVAGEALLCHEEGLGFCAAVSSGGDDLAHLIHQSCLEEAPVHRASSAQDHGIHVEKILDFFAGQGKVHTVFPAEKVTDALPAEEILIAVSRGFCEDFHYMGFLPFAVGGVLFPGQFPMAVQGDEVLSQFCSFRKEIPLRYRRGFFIDFRLPVQGGIVIHGGPSQKLGLVIVFRKNCVEGIFPVSPLRKPQVFSHDLPVRARFHVADDFWSIHIYAPFV